MNPGPSIYEVATVAGVAASTVSRAFSRPNRVNCHTAERIYAAAREVGYPFKEPAAPARQRTRSLAVVVADISSPTCWEMICGADEAAKELGFRIVLSHARGDGRLERGWTERDLVAVEGVLLTASRMSHEAIRMLSRQKPLVVLDRRIPGVHCVVNDVAGGVRRAVEHLAGLGHTSLTYVAGPEGSWADGMRWDALTSGCQALGLRFHRVGPCNVPTVQAGHDAAAGVLAQGSTAVVAFNDVMAVGVIKGMRRAGVRVPGDLSVIGFDNVVVSEIVDPELTTVAAPYRTMGFTGVKSLVAAVSGTTQCLGPTVLPVKLVVRGSTGQPTRKATAMTSGTTGVLESASRTQFIPAARA